MKCYSHEMNSASSWGLNLVPYDLKSGPLTNWPPTLFQTKIMRFGGILFFFCNCGIPCFAKTVLVSLFMGTDQWWIHGLLKFALVFHDCIQMSHQGQQHRQDVKVHKTTLFSKCFSNLMPSSVKQIHLLLHLYHFPKRQSLPFIQTGNDVTQCLALWLKFSTDYILKHFSYFFFPRKQVLTFHANCLQWRQFA